MMPTTAGPMMAPHPAAMSQEMLFSQFPHAGGDHMTRPPHFPPATAAAAYGMPHHWPGAADQPGGMAPRPFMMHPQMMQHYQYQQIQHQLHQQAVAAQQAQQVRYIIYIYIHYIYRCYMSQQIYLKLS